jgi:hypothetical protein
MWHIMLAGAKVSSWCKGPLPLTYICLGGIVGQNWRAKVWLAVVQGSRILRLYSRPCAFCFFDLAPCAFTFFNVNRKKSPSPKKDLGQLANPEVGRD